MGCCKSRLREDDYSPLAGGDTGRAVGARSLSLSGMGAEAAARLGATPPPTPAPLLLPLAPALPVPPDARHERSLYPAEAGELGPRLALQARRRA